MDLYRRTITEFLPEKLSSVPIPRSIGGIFRLSLSEFVSLTAFSGVVGFLGYSVYTTCRLHIGSCCASSNSSSCINKCVEKDRDKVVSFVQIEDIGEKVSLCRCWKSKKFPYCDGAHNRHNQDTGDNVGPVVVKR